MLPRRSKWPRAAAIPAPLVPPDLNDIGQVAFTADDHSRLQRWLREDGWPRDHMNIHMLEGYLVAMIVWPVELSPGAWLPAIWGIRGWKVPVKIAAPEEYLQFSLLVVGFRQHLASLVNTRPRSYVPDFRSDGDDATNSNAAMHWSVGFLLALQGGAQGFHWRSAEVTAAVQVIADHALPRHPPNATTLQLIAAELGAAVRAIVLDRSVGHDSSVLKPRVHAPLH